MAQVPSLEETVESLVQLVRDLAQASTVEAIRLRGDALLNADWHRRHVRDGKHPIAGETQEEYEAHMDDPKRGVPGIHPVTGESRSTYDAAATFGKKEAKPSPKA